MSTAQCGAVRLESPAFNGFSALQRVRHENESGQLPFVEQRPPPAVIHLPEQFLLLGGESDRLGSQIACPLPYHPFTLNRVLIPFAVARSDGGPGDLGRTEGVEHVQSLILAISLIKDSAQ